MKISSLFVLFMIAFSAVVIAATVEELTATLAEQIDEAQGVEPNVKTFTKTLLPHCTNPVFVAAVGKQNAKGLSLDQIKQIDKEWVEAEDELPIHSELIKNACADEIRKIIKKNPIIREAFVTDNQGANVGQNDLTSDYWQGDEAKWQDAYNDGKGGVHYGKNKFDKSTNTVLQHIGLPIINPDGEVIGAVCYGVAIDEL